jgi:predicted TIM-barrel fold metal-dependent hydrolase
MLHCYPYRRQAGYLAQVYPHVRFDTGSAVSHSGLGSLQLVRESLEVAPFDKVLFSTDGSAWRSFTCAAPSFGAAG